MLEHDIIQQKGFRNLVKDGKVVGFQVAVRQISYRGAWLSQFRCDHLSVDGVCFEADDFTIVIAGVEYTLQELQNQDRVKWPVDEPAYFRIRKEGGLATGAHTLCINHWQIRSYLPVDWEIQNHYDETRNNASITRELILV